jgi:hypothetical protein
MASKLEIKNMALQSLGEEPMSSDGESTKSAVMAETFFQQSLDELLARHDWVFARRRAQISYEVSTPAFGYSYQYLLPSDCIRISIINSDKNKLYSVELGKILMDDDECELLYVSRVSNYELLPPMFVASLSALIASKLAYGLSGGDTKAKEQLSIHQLYYAEAISADKTSGLGTDEGTEYGEGVGEWPNRGS